MLKTLKKILIVVVVAFFCDALFVFIFPSIAKYFMLQSGGSNEAGLYICNSMSHVGEIGIVLVIAYVFLFHRREK